ncbi:sarcosine oxidase subunit delta [Candidatus Palauibacter soopunensis]|uniref:sarcosine oxidase subunit delta n=1 Tax=Candidatus Palauibacter soopunensis TaxID=3056739 RepID=UPI00238D1AD2|nr:sarcosine oxidase subunit delta [Candidatus Palauibacter soopunensis]MDE2877641.1 sarcosine oxidase subunit delta [Candidatus Palauibacter soopunensis]
MTFRLTCPVCGKRDVYEFTYGGPERGPRPAEAEPAADPDPAAGSDPGAAAEAHFRWAQFRMNRLEPHEEWWHHGAGCGVWFSTWRDPATNRETRPGGGDAGENEASGGDPS